MNLNRRKEDALGREAVHRTHAEQFLGNQLRGIQNALENNLRIGGRRAAIKVHEDKGGGQESSLEAGAPFQFREMGIGIGEFQNQAGHGIDTLV